MPTINLTMKGSHKVESFDHPKQDKWTVWEEKLSVKGFCIYNLVRATKICLVPDIVVPKKFRVSEFVKYVELECPNMHSDHITTK